MGCRGEAATEEEAVGDSMGATITVKEVAARLGNNGKGGLQHRRDGGVQRMWLALMATGKLLWRAREGRGQRRQAGEAAAEEDNDCRWGMAACVAG
ncbi:hypothetical protein BHM03_00043944 [Ensete ventricosum]|nr:hypothetical protein BHM03_00043944 [Ensete ventricosum]